MVDGIFSQVRNTLQELLPWHHGPESWRYRSTADDILRNTDLSGKLCIVTGGSCGIGLEAAIALCKRGAKVISTARDMTKARAAINLHGLTDRDRLRLEVETLDLHSIASIEKLCEAVKARQEPVSLLLLNAGAMHVGSIDRVRLASGVEPTMMSNHFGHFKLFKELRPLLEEQDEQCRVVLTSSRAHRFSSFKVSDLHYKNEPWRAKFGWGAYSDSKLANILMAKEINRRCMGNGVLAFSVHPGVVATSFFRNCPKPINALVQQPWFIRLIAGKRQAKTTAQGAGQLVWAATNEDLRASPGAYVANCQVMNTLVPQAEDGKVARDLWEASERVVSSLEMGERVT